MTVNPDSQPCIVWPMWLRAADLSHIAPISGPRFDHALQVIEAALAGEGVALAHKILVEADLAKGRLVQPFGQAHNCSFAYHLVCPRENLALAPVAAFRKWLQDEMRRTRVCPQPAHFFGASSTFYLVNKFDRLS